MTIESPVNYIGDLDDSYPAEGESNTLHEGNDHIRNIKTALLNTLGSPGAAAYTLAGITTYTSGSGTYTPTTGVRAIFVECYGGGGGGGATSSSYWGISSPGGGGAYCAKLITSLAASYTYAVGAGGATMTTDAGYGNPGGSTTFSGSGVSLTAPGGYGGIQSYGTGGSSSIGQGTGAAIATGGDINLAGKPSDFASAYVIGGSNYVCGVPNSGDCAGPMGGKGVVHVTDGNALAGNAPGGGGGCAYATTNALYSGGAGGAGMIRITEYY